MSETTPLSESSAPPEVPRVEQKQGSRGLRIALKTLGVLCGLMGVLVIIGFLLPSTYAIERSIVIDGQPVDIHEQVEDLRQWPKWIAWSKEHDPDKYGDLEYTYSEKARGKGATQSWDDPDAGKGRLEIIETDLDNGIHFTLQFDDGPPSRGSIQYHTAEGGTKVTWRLRGETGNNPIGRWMHVLFVNKMIEKDYETGLAKLKDIAEKNAAERIKRQNLASNQNPPEGAPRAPGGPGGFGGRPGGPGGGGRGGRGGRSRDPQAFITRMMQNDKNKDGKISKEEMPERGRQFFDRMDENKDGVVDQAELKKTAASMAQGGGGRGARGGRGGRPTRKKRPPLEEGNAKTKKSP